jgi:hypothetical protein
MPVVYALQPIPNRGACICADLFSVALEDFSGIRGQIPILFMSGI